MPEHFVAVGASLAGLRAAGTARTARRDLRITLFDLAQSLPQRTEQ